MKSKATAIKSPETMRREIHSELSKLGHIPLRCAQSFECPRCGASGAIDEHTGERMGEIFSGTKCGAQR